MKELSKIVDLLLNQYRLVSPSILSTQGVFYPPDLKIWITQPTKEQIAAYKKSIDEKPMSAIVDILIKNVHLSKSYDIYDIRSSDVLSLFLEIVSHHNKRPIEANIIFSEKYVEKTTWSKNTRVFFDFDKYKKELHNEAIHINGWAYSPPTLGAELSLLNYIAKERPYATTLDELPSFMYFLGNKKYLSDKEIETLYSLFEDLSDKDKTTIEQIISDMSEISCVSAGMNERGDTGRLELKLSTIFQDL